MQISIIYLTIPFDEQSIRTDFFAILFPIKIHFTWNTLVCLIKWHGLKNVNAVFCCCCWLLFVSFYSSLFYLNRLPRLDMQMRANCCRKNSKINTWAFVHFCEWAINKIKIKSDWIKDSLSSVWKSIERAQETRPQKRTFKSCLCQKIKSRISQIEPIQNAIN